MFIYQVEHVYIVLVDYITPASCLGLLMWIIPESCISARITPTALTPNSSSKSSPLSSLGTVRPWSVSTSRSSRLLRLAPCVKTAPASYTWL